MADVGGVEAEEVESDGFGGREVGGVEGDEGEVVESDGGSGGGDMVEVRGGGAGVEGRSGDEDGYGEGRVVGEDELA